MAAGDPTGEDLAVGTTNGNTLDADPSFTEREITFGSSIELTSGVKYAIVIRCSNALGSLGINVYAPGTGYTDGIGTSSNNSGGSWAEQGYDLWFKTKAVAVEKDTYTFSTSSRTAASLTTWIAQTFIASSTYTITSVILKLNKLFSRLPGTVTVSIRATEGAPTKATTPAPSNAATNVTLDQATITWVDGGGADTYNVYYGDTSGSLPLVSSTQAGTSFTVTGITDGSPYAYLDIRYWRIDSTNGAGTTTGDEWSFTTIRFSAPTVTYFYSTTGQYYQLLIQSDGSYGDVPGVGVENTDYVFLAAGYEPNFIKTTRKLVGVANSKVWYEDI